MLIDLSPHPLTSSLTTLTIRVYVRRLHSRAVILGLQVPSGGVGVSGAEQRYLHSASPTG